MLPRAPLRFVGVLTAAVVPFAAALSCGDNTIQITECGTPTVSEKAADGGPDPCHCDPSPSSGIMSCPCLSGNQQDIDNYNACMVLYRAEADGGAGGGH